MDNILTACLEFLGVSLTNFLEGDSFPDTHVDFSQIPSGLGTNILPVGYDFGCFQRPF
jgi:hypothetical protein